MKKRKKQVYALNNIGKKRKENQDRVLIMEECSFYAVSDGMGGAMYGEKSAELICTVLKTSANTIYEDYQLNHDIEQAKEKWKEEVTRLNRHLFRKGNTKGGLYYGATLCAVMFLFPYILWINVGDSRGYLLPDYCKSIVKLTKDHNLAETVVSCGFLTESEAKKRGLSSSLYNYMGIDPKGLTIDVQITKYHRGDCILLCSDGLYGMVSDRNMLHIIRNHRSPERTCRHLIKQANKNGGNDNISVIIIK